MIWYEAVAIFAAGFVAGTINAVVGSGSLVTFPTLLAFGYPPVQSSLTNTVGLMLGQTSAAVGYRAELRGQGRRLVRLGIASLLGAVTGGFLLLRLPAETFQAVVPILIIIACVLVVIQPWLARRLAARRSPPEHGGVPLLLGVFVASVYGGYFGAAQGVILIALLGIFLQDGLQRLNGAKNVCSAVVNIAAAVLFVIIAPVAWIAAALIAGGSIVGGQVGAIVGRRLPPFVLRAVIVVVGTIATISLLLD